MKPISPKVFWQTYLGLSILLSVWAIYQTVQQVSSLDVVLWRSKWILLVGMFALNILAGLFLLGQLSRETGTRWIEMLDLPLGNISNKFFGFVLLVLGFSIVWIAKLFIFDNLLPQTAPIFWVFLWASLLQSLGLKLATGHKWHALFVFIILVQGLIYQIWGHLSIVSDYPFSIGYSEAGRHYYASLFYSKSIYEMQLPLPFLHPTRYFLMSIPFLVEGLPLWFHRLWQSLLWIGLTAISSFLLASRLALKGWIQFYVATWTFLYFLQGAVYYHLQICVILILVGVSTRHFWRSLLVVLVASVWAGVSRVNWFPVPAMLAIAIYILETAFREKGWRYWLTLIIWGVLGFAAAIISQLVYATISGNVDISTFGSSFSSDLLWNRLLPNKTFSLGILLGITLVSAPLVMAIIQMVHEKLYQLHPLRWSALLAMLVVLFLGGLIVSVKIGGGADLHNMDALFVLLALIAAYLFAGRVSGEDDPNPVWGQIHWSVLMTALLVPIGFAFSQIGYFPSYDHGKVEKDIQKLQQVISVAVNNQQAVLFVTERQLLTFKVLNNIPLIPEYEQSELMEMAMSGNREYLEQYYADLQSHRFAIIVVEKQKLTQQKENAFVEENNAWVRYIGAPLLCSYKPVESLLSTNVQIFVPRPAQPSCKNPFSE